MENLNAEQIKFALVCHADWNGMCEQCPYTISKACGSQLARDALDLIKNLTSDNEKIGIQNFDLVCELSRIKEDTVRKMQERLKARNKVYCTNESDLKEMNFVVDQIAKEMLEGGE